MPDTFFFSTFDARELTQDDANWTDAWKVTKVDGKWQVTFEPFFGDEEFYDDDAFKPELFDTFEDAVRWVKD